MSYDIHHGLNNGIGLPRIWAYNQQAAVRKYYSTMNGHEANGVTKRKTNATTRAVAAGG